MNTGTSHKYFCSENASETVYHYGFSLTFVYVSISTLSLSALSLLATVCAAWHCAVSQFPWAVCVGEPQTTSFLKRQLWRTLLLDLALTSRSGGGVSPFQLYCHTILIITEDLTVAGSFSDGPFLMAPVFLRGCRCICCCNKADIANVFTDAAHQKLYLFLLQSNICILEETCSID